MKETIPLWWTYVKHILKEYPNLCEELEALKISHTTTNYQEHIRGKGKIPRPVEEAADRKLAANKQKKYEAVTKAIDLTKKRYRQNGGDRVKIIEMVYFNQECNINGAAMKIPCHPNTAARWQGDFIRLVADILQLP